MSAKRWSRACAASLLLAGSTGQAESIPLEEPGRAALEPAEVLASVDRAFPLLERARRERDGAHGRALAAQGAFDLQLRASAQKQDGDYRNERLDAGFQLPLAMLGITVSGGFRRGVGRFAEYDEKARTSEGGQWRAGWSVPLLRDRALDERRAGTQLTQLGADAAEHEMQTARIGFLEKALEGYWNWVAAGRQLAITDELLALAERRDEDLREAVALGQVAPVERTDNRRAILQRRSAQVAAQRALQGAAIELSLYYRDPNGSPLQPPLERLPSRFPEAPALDLEEELEAIEIALRRRPELAALQLEREQREVEVRLAANARLPALDLVGEFTRERGDDREPADTEFQTGLRFELPTQRREAAGKAHQARARLAAVEAELRYTQDRVRAQVQDAASALRAALASVELTREELAVARELEALELERFEMGDSNQFLVNLRELASADAAMREAKARAECQKAQVGFEAASGLLLERLGAQP